MGVAGDGADGMEGYCAWYGRGRVMVKTLPSRGSSRVAPGVGSGLAMLRKLLNEQMP